MTTSTRASARQSAAATAVPVRITTEVTENVCPKKRTTTNQSVTTITTTEVTAAVAQTETEIIATKVVRGTKMTMEQTMLKQGERLDDLQINGYQIIQHPDKFCFGMDAVLLSAFVRCREGARVVDLGTGTGVIPILLTAKTNAAHIDALEIQEESADMARRSVRFNHLEDKITVIDGDIKTASQTLGLSAYDIVTTNPPYMNDSHGLKNPALPKAIARHEVLCTLEDVVSEGCRLLKTGGHFFMVHRPFRLVEIITVLSKYKLEPKRLRFVHPFAGREPNMVLIDAVRGGNSMVKVEAPLIIYETQGVYTEEILEIYDKQ
jgi:tRNA1Val (adenine37-N6)-methyltransferase